MTSLPISPGNAFRFVGWPHCNLFLAPRSPDGQCLILSARDGYCTLIIFDDIIPAYHTQQRALQMQSIAQQHSFPVMSNVDGLASGTPNPKKRSEPPLTPAASVDGDKDPMPSSFSFPSQPSTSSVSSEQDGTEPPKKKRRIALTRVGDLDTSL